MTYKGVIFDLDGTLIDTLDDLTDSMNFGLVQIECPVRSRTECRQMVGDGLLKFAERALPEGRKDLRDRLTEIMVEHYREHCLIKTTPFTGIVEVVEQLRQKGIRLAVLTNKNQKPAEAIVKHFFGDGFFDTVIGIHEGRKVKPDPSSTHEILRQWDLSAEQAVFVGDSEVDIQTARAAGVLCVGCEWGFRDREHLLAAGAEILIRRPEQILEIIL